MDGVLFTQFISNGNFLNGKGQRQSYDTSVINSMQETYFQCNIQMASSVTRSGDLLDFGQHLKAFGNN